MKLEVYSCMVLRLIVGVALILHALYNVFGFEAYTFEVHSYLKAGGLSYNTFYALTTSLFPFIEFLLGAFLVLKLFYARTIVFTVAIFSVAAVFLFTMNEQPLAAAALFISCSSLYIYLHKKDQNILWHIESGKSMF